VAGGVPEMMVECPTCGRSFTGDKAQKELYIHRKYFHELPTVVEKPSAVQPVCPECGSMITHQEGCLFCRDCGWNRCG